MFLSTFGKSDTFVFLMRVAKLKGVSLVNGKQRIKGLGENLLILKNLVL